MKITDVTAVYPKYRYVVPSWRTHFWQIVVRVETDTGATGFGYDGGGVAGVEIVNRHFRELLMGREINSLPDIIDTWDYLYEQSLPYGRKGLAIMALSGVDLALYDLLAKAENQPVYELLGGARKPSVLAYATGQSRKRTATSASAPTSSPTGGLEPPTTKRPQPRLPKPAVSTARMPA